MFLFFINLSSSIGLINLNAKSYEKSTLHSCINPAELLFVKKKGDPSVSIRQLYKNIEISGDDSPMTGIF